MRRIELRKIPLFQFDSPRYAFCVRPIRQVSRIRINPPSGVLSGQLDQPIRLTPRCAPRNAELKRPLFRAESDRVELRRRCVQICERCYNEGSACVLHSVSS